MSDETYPQIMDDEAVPTDPAPPAEETEETQETDEVDDEQAAAEEEVDLKRLHAQCRAEELPAAGTAAAGALYRQGIIPGPPDLKNVLLYVGSAPPADVTNVDGIGPAGYKVLAELAEDLAEAQVAEDPAQEPAPRNTPSAQPESASTVRVVPRDETVHLEKGDKDEDIEEGIDLARHRLANRRRDQDHAAVRIVHRTNSSAVECPPCEKCPSDTTVVRTGRRMRYFSCMSPDCDYTTKRPR